MTGGRLHFGVLLTAVCVMSSVAGENLGFYQISGGGSRHTRSILQNFAVDRMLKDKGFVRSIINCVLDKGPCESNGRKLRLMAPEILRGQCPGCSRTVHNQIRKVISHVQRNFPVEWSEVTRRFMSYTPGQGFGAPQPAYSPPQPAPQFNQQPPPPPSSYNPQPPSSYNPQQPSSYNPQQSSQSFNPPQQSPPSQYNPGDPNPYQNVYG